MTDPAPTDPPTPDAPKAPLITAEGVLVMSIALSILFLLGGVAAWWLQMREILTYMIFAVITLMTQVSGFWFGSSKGSQAKDAIIAAQLPPPQAPVNRVPPDLPASAP